MLKNILLYTLGFFLFAVPNFIFYNYVLPLAWAACSCVENVVQMLIITYGAFVFALPVVLTTMYLRRTKSLLYSYIFSWIIFSIMLFGTGILLISQANTLGKIFPALIPSASPYREVPVVRQK